MEVLVTAVVVVTSVSVVGLQPELVVESNWTNLQPSASDFQFFEVKV